MQDGIVLLLGSFLPFDFCLWFYVSVALNVKIDVHCFHFRQINMFEFLLIENKKYHNLGKK